MSARDQKQPTVIAPQRPPSITLTPEQFERLRDTLAAYGGVYLDAAQQRVLEAGLARRLAATGDDLERYQRRVTMAGGREELRRLAEQVLNHETFFFRNQPHLRALREVLLPEIHRRKPAGEPIRLWSAGCATGEEPYSLAIAAFEALGHTGRTFEVYGTDLSETALAKARAGIYRGRSLNNVAPQLLERFFRPHEDGYQVSETLRGVVQFAQLNLLEPFPEFVRGCDAIFCQNVTIYFRAEARRELIGRFYEWLPPGGLLFLGFSETLWNVFDHFRARQVAGAYVYCKEPSDAARRPEGIRPAADRRRPTPALAGKRQVAAERPQVSAGVAGNHAVRAEQQSDAGILASSHALLDEGRVAEALELLRGISPKSPLAAEALTLVAHAHADRGNLEQAVAEVRRALEIEALNDEAYLLLGVIYGRQGEWLAAARELERARYLQPEAPLVSFHLADAYRHTGRAELAAREYRSALRKLAHHPPDRLLGGVAVSWLRETCERQLENLLQP
jgi:chemotaxis protein methyltransferase CheR